MLELASSLTVANDPADALRASVNGLGAHLAVERCLFAEVDSTAATADVKAEFRAEAATSLLRSFQLDVYRDSLPDLVKGRSLVIQDARTDERTSKAYEKSYAPLGLTSLLISPIHEHGRLAAALMLTSSTTRTWQPREIALAQAAAERTFLCVERLQNVAALRDMSKELERRVEARTRELQSALREKEVLLKEIHHRVKNNLQVISSLLNLQAMHVTDPAAQAMFAESQGRVQSIALVHESLYSSADLSSVDFVDYIHTLVNTVIQAQARPERQIATVIDAGSVRLPVGSAIPCGLIINELVTNSLKHAFKGRDRGEIRVSLHNRGPHRIELIVADDGVGLPTDLNLRRVSTLGLDLVFTFAEQLGAEISVQSEHGTTFTVVFQDHP
jgi:two-component sensor histidine kinase